MKTLERIVNWFSERGKANPQLMIEHMLNKSSDDLGGRDDCAMDLGAYDLPEVEQALTEVVTDLNEDEMIVDSAIESLIAIWNRQGRTAQQELIKKMHPSIDIKGRFGSDNT